MRMCAELADIGMKLARAVGTKALADWVEPEAPPAAEQPPEPEIAASIGPAPAPGPSRTPSLSVRALSCKSGDWALIFTRVAACVRACIALEARLAAGLTPACRGTSPTLRTDPRRTPLRDIFHRITEHHPDRAELIRETTARIDQDLAADPDRTIELSNLFFTICEDLAIEVDLAIIPDKFLGFTYDPTAPREAPTETPDPRATSPP
jgi:hypothetical protein